MKTTPIYQGGTSCPSCVKNGGTGLTFSIPVSLIELSLGHKRYKCAVCKDEFKLTKEQLNK